MLDFHSEIRIAADGVLTVTEVIVVQAEGQQIRRGILRDFPTDYRDRRGARVVVPFEVLRVSRNGELERFKVERLENGVRLRIGDPDQALRYGRHTYEIRYRTARQVGFFEAHDELYWNVNGNGWSFAFDAISAEVKLPQAVPAASLKAEAFTGPVGAQGRSYQAFTADGSAAFRSTRPFQPPWRRKSSPKRARSRALMSMWYAGCIDTRAKMYLPFEARKSCMPIGLAKRCSTAAKMSSPVCWR